MFGKTPATQGTACYIVACLHLWGNKLFPSEKWSRHGWGKAPHGRHLHTIQHVGACNSTSGIHRCRQRSVLPRHGLCSVTAEAVLGRCHSGYSSYVGQAGRSITYTWRRNAFRRTCGGQDAHVRSMLERLKVNCSPTNDEAPGRAELFCWKNGAVTAG